jgi:sugar phosphate isomerase/epimerase
VEHETVNGLTGRRKFLSAAARLLAAAMAAPAIARALETDAPSRSFGLQLFTLFNVMDADVKGTLQTVARIGYRDLQSSFTRLGGIYGMTPRAFAAMVSDLGMRWSSHHVPGGPRRIDPAARQRLDINGRPMVYAKALNLQDNMQELIDQVADGGPRYLVCAGVPTDTLDEVHASIALLNRAGEACRKAGLILALHNHEAEFRRLSDATPYELILKGTDPGLLTMELDIGWAMKAGVDPVALFARYPGRFGLWHVKDIDSKLQKPVPLGQGAIDFPRIFDHANVAGMKHYYVEHDFPSDPIASITTSYHYLRRMFNSH